MEHPKIIKNTVQGKHPIIQEKINQVSKQVELPRASTLDKKVVVPGVMQSQVRSIQAVQKPWKSNRMEDVLVDTERLVPMMQKVQNTKVVNTVKISQVQYIDETVKDPSDRAEAGADDTRDAERTKGTPGYPVYLNRPSPQGSPSAERSTSRG